MYEGHFLDCPEHTGHADILSQKGMYLRLGLQLFELLCCCFLWFGDLVQYSAVRCDVLSDPTVPPVFWCDGFLMISLFFVTASRQHAVFFSDN